MKKFLTIILTIAIVTSLSACNNSSNEENNSTAITSNNSSNIATEDKDINDTSIEDTNSSESTHTHKYVDKVTVATCTKEGYTLHTCSCGDSYSDNKTAATGHNFGEWNTTKEPTPTTTGSAERKCSKCNKKETKTLGRLIENHKHSYTSKITDPPSCKANGKMTYSCFCGDSYIEEVASIDHQYSHKVTKPTCTNEGYTTYTCTVCGNSYRDDFTHPTEHNWKAATCTVEKICLSCGKTEGIVYGHSWKNATCTTPQTCKVCGETKGAALGHSWKAATCTKAKVCNVCKVSEGSANGHSWIAGNCTTPKTCSVCNIMEGEAVHTFVNNKCSLCGCKKPSEGLSFYEYKGGYYLLTAGSCSDTNIVIPTTYRGKPVVGIYKNFSERTNNDDRAVINSDSITSIYIPDCITDIGAHSFCQCSNLTSIVFEGTKQQWKAISKGDHWYFELCTIIVTCTDGSITYS